MTDARICVCGLLESEKAWEVGDRGCPECLAVWPEKLRDLSKGETGRKFEAPGEGVKWYWHPESDSFVEHTQVAPDEGAYWDLVEVGDDKAKEEFIRKFYTDRLQVLKDAVNLFLHLYNNIIDVIEGMPVSADKGRLVILLKDFRQNFIQQRLKSAHDFPEGSGSI